MIKVEMRITENNHLEYRIIDVNEITISKWEDAGELPVCNHVCSSGNMYPTQPINTINLQENPTVSPI